MKTRLLAVFILLMPLCALGKDNSSVLKEARNSWLDGRIEDAIESYKYLIFISTGDAEHLQYNREMLILLNNIGKSADAKIYAEKLEALGVEDPYVKYEKALALYNLKNYPLAKKNFDEIQTITADSNIVYNSIFMAGICEAELGGHMKAVENFQTVYRKYPYLLSASAYMIAESYEKAKKRSVSINFLKEALTYDSMNIQALIKLAKIYDDVDYYLPAWQSYYTLSELDSDNRFFAKAKKRLLKYVSREKNPENLLYWSRLAWPAHSEAVKTEPGKPIKLGLYSNGDIHYEITAFGFISNSDFIIKDAKLGIVYTGKKRSNYIFSYRQNDRIFELKDVSGSRVYSTRQNFSIIPKDLKEVILVKSPVFQAVESKADRGDRELTGSLDIFVSTSGMRLVNNTFREHLLLGIVSKMDIPKDNMEFLKAVTILMRTAIDDYINSPSSARYDICDYKKCFEYIGLQYENSQVSKAISLTESQTLKADYGKTLTLHQACGGKTHSNVSDGGDAPKEINPFSLNKWFMTAPPQNLLCLPDDSTLFSKALWAVILDPYWIEERINSKYKVGQIKNIIVLKRDSRLRPYSIKVIGSAADALIEGINLVDWALSGNTFRSQLYDVRPIMKGNKAAYFLARGIGTGDLEDFCLSGAYGLAKHHGYPCDKIILHYFPGSSIKNLPQKKRK